MFLWDSDPLNTSEIHFVHCKGSFEFKLTFLNADCKAILLVALLFLFLFLFSYKMHFVMSFFLLKAVRLNMLF